VLWEQSELRRRPLPYPAAAPPLAPGVLYTWELEAPEQPSQQTRFEILFDAEAARIREQLALLAGAPGPGYSAGTLRVMRAAVLYQAGLYQEVRRELETTVTGSDDPTGYTLLGHVYERVGLSSRAALAFERARALADTP
jgi:predicted Zn-dependent protease